MKALIFALLVLVGCCSSSESADPIKLTPPQRTANPVVFADEAFDPLEHQAVLDALQAWETKTRVRFRLVWVDHQALRSFALAAGFVDAIYLYRQTEVGDESCPSATVAPGSPTHAVETGYLGYAWSHGDQTVICVIPLPDRVVFFRTVMHEFGHALHLEHVPGPNGVSVMIPVPWFAANHVTDVDAREIERLYP